MRNKKRILFFMINLSIGGAEWVVTNICNEFVKKNVDVTLLSVKGGELVNHLDEGVNIVTFNGNNLKAFWFAYRNLLFREYDAVFATQRFASVILSFLHLFSFSNSTLTIREAASNFGHSLKKNTEFRRLYYKIAYRRADKIISNSPGTLMSLLEEKIILNDDKVSIISNPLDINYIQEKSNEFIEDDINFSRHSLISVGRLVPKKKMDVIVRAIPKIKENIPDVQLLILGEGEERKNLEKIISDLNLKNHVMLLGHKKNPYPYLKNSDQFILASEWEGFGMVVVEALALGTPVIVTDIDSGPKQIIEGGKYGSLVPINSPEKISMKVVSNYNINTDKEYLIMKAKEFDKENISKHYYKAIFG